jgi:hypothetical protein
VVVEKILRHLGLPVEAPMPAPARTPAWLRGGGLYGYYQDAPRVPSCGQRLDRTGLPEVEPQESVCETSM